MSEICQNCGKEESSGKAGSMTSYFFEHKYCQCERRKQKNLRLSKRATAPGKNGRICLACGKSRPEDQKVGSFTAFLFKELRCQCSKPKFAEVQNKRTQVADRIKQKRQTARRQLDSLGDGTAVPIGPGTIIGGTFKIISIIGEGGMGTVYLVQHRTLAQKFALKILAQSLVSEQYWLRFQTEAKTLAALKHPNLVNVYDLGIHENSVFYYSMDYLEGQNLETILAREGPQTLERTIEIFLAVLDGLAYAHRNSIVHRDIKPANIFICNKGTSTDEVKILDFGIAKLVKGDNAGQELTAVGEIFGSPYYMSPEQCMGTAVDARSDIYSVGCAMFETLSGFVPFEADSSLEIALMHEEDEPPLLSTVASNQSPSSVDTVIAKCLAKNPRDRYQSAKELSLDLERIQAGKDVAAYRSAGPKERQVSVENEIEDEKALKGPLIITLAAATFLSLGGFLLWNTLFPPVATKAENIAIQGKTMHSSFAEEIPDETGLETSNVDKFLNSDRPYYGGIVYIQGIKHKVFLFPSDFSLGKLSFSKNHQTSEATGKLVIPYGTELSLTADNGYIAQFPDLLKCFQKDDLAALRFKNVDESSGDLLRYVCELSLNSLVLSTIEINPKDFVYLDRLRTLKRLQIQLGADGAHFSKLKILPQLSDLSITNSSPISPVVEKLSHGSKLRRLYLQGTSLSDKDCKNIASMEKLEELIFSDIPVTNQNLERLISSPKLEKLTISGDTKLTSACSSALIKIKSLRQVALAASVLSPDQIAKAKHLAPNLSIVAFETTYPTVVRQTKSFMESDRGR